MGPLSAFTPSLTGAWQNRVVITEGALLTRLLTVKEAAELLHVHVNTVRNWSGNGLLPSYRVGKRADRRFLWGDVQKLLRKSSRR